MSHLPFDFTAADRSKLVDELTKLIAQVPQLIGTEVNWIEQSIQSILRAFEEQTMEGDDSLTRPEIDERIRVFVTDESNLFAPTKAAEKVFSKLKEYFEERSCSASAQDTPIPTDETHDFGIIAKELIDNGSGIDMLQFGPSVILTEQQALRALAGLKDLDGDVEFVLIARPKPPRWTVLYYQG